MKVRDLQLYLRYSLSKDILLSFVRSNFLGLISIFVIVNVIDYYDYFEEDEMLYLVFTGIILLFSLVVFVKYKIHFLTTQDMFYSLRIGTML